MFATSTYNEVVKCEQYIGNIESGSELHRVCLKTKYCINVNDSTLAIDVLSHVELSGSNVLGDKAYGTVAIRDYTTSKECHLAECFSTNSSSSEELQHIITSLPFHL